jgi:cytochrome c-type biogenesis protein CcmH/NrfG
MFRIRFFTISVWIWTQASASAFRPNPTPEEIADLSRRIAADPGNSRNLQYRGLDYAVLGEKDRAIADYQAASKITPVNHYFFWSYGWALFDLGD